MTALALLLTAYATGLTASLVAWFVRKGLGQ